jgi:hypothetical protein
MAGSGGVCFSRGKRHEVELIVYSHAFPFVREWRRRNAASPHSERGKGCAIGVTRLKKWRAPQDLPERKWRAPQMLPERKWRAPQMLPERKWRAPQMHPERKWRAPQMLPERKWRA